MKRNWKKVLCLILAAAMVFTMDTSALAADMQTVQPKQPGQAAENTVLSGDEAAEATDAAARAEASMSISEAKLPAASDDEAAISQDSIINTPSENDISVDAAGYAPGAAVGNDEVCGLMFAPDENVNVIYSGDRNHIKITGSGSVTVTGEEEATDPITISSDGTKSVAIKFENLTSGKNVKIQNCFAEFSKTLKENMECTASYISGNGVDIIIDNGKPKNPIKYGRDPAQKMDENIVVYVAEESNIQPDFYTGGYSFDDGKVEFCSNYGHGWWTSSQNYCWVEKYEYTNGGISDNQVYYYAKYDEEGHVYYYKVNVPEKTATPSWKGSQLDESQISYEEKGAKGIRINADAVSDYDDYYYALSTKSYASFYKGNSQYWHDKNNLIVPADGQESLTEGATYHIFAIAHKDGCIWSDTKEIGSFIYKTFPLILKTSGYMTYGSRYDTYSNSSNSYFEIFYNNERYSPSNSVSLNFCKKGTTAPLSEEEIVKARAGTELDVYATKAVANGNVIKSNTVQATVLKRTIWLALASSGYTCSSQRGKELLTTVDGSKIMASSYGLKNMPPNFDTDILADEYSKLTSPGEVLKGDAALDTSCADKNRPGSYTAYLGGTLASDFADNYQLVSSSVSYTVKGDYSAKYVMNYSAGGVEKNAVVTNALGTECNPATDAVDKFNTILKSSNASTKLGEARVTKWIVYRDESSSRQRDPYYIADGKKYTYYDTIDLLDNSDIKDELQADGSYSLGGYDNYFVAVVSTRVSESVDIASIQPVSYDGMEHVAEWDAKRYDSNAFLNIELTNEQTGKALKNGTDFTVKYKNNTNASVYFDEADTEQGTGNTVKLNKDPDTWPCVLITGKGDYQGMNATVYFDILPRCIQRDAEKADYKYYNKKTKRFYEDKNFYNVQIDGLGDLYPVGSSGIKCSYDVTDRVLFDYYIENDLKDSDDYKDLTAHGIKAISLKKDVDYKEELQKKTDHGTWVEAASNSSMAAGIYRVKLTGIGNYYGQFAYTRNYTSAADKTYGEFQVVPSGGKLFRNNKIKFKRRTLKWVEGKAVSVNSFNIKLYYAGKKANDKNLIDPEQYSYGFYKYDSETGEYNKVTGESANAIEDAGTYFIRYDVVPGYEGVAGYGSSDYIKVTIAGSKPPVSKFRIGWKKCEYRGAWIPQTVDITADYDTYDTPVYKMYNVKTGKWEDSYDEEGNGGGIYPGDYKIVIKGRKQYGGNTLELKYTITRMKLSKAVAEGLVYIEAPSATVNTSGTTAKITIHEYLKYKKPISANKSGIVYVNNSYENRQEHIYNSAEDDTKSFAYGNWTDYIYWTSKNSTSVADKTYAAFQVTSWGKSSAAGSTKITLSSVGKTGYIGTASVKFTINPKTISKVYSQHAGTDVKPGEVYAVVGDVKSGSKPNVDLYQVNEEGSSIKKLNQKEYTYTCKGSDAMGNTVTVKNGSQHNFDFGTDGVIADATYGAYRAAASGVRVVLDEEQNGKTLLKKVADRETAVFTGYFIVPDLEVYVGDSSKPVKIAGRTAKLYYKNFFNETLPYVSSWSDDGSIEARFTNNRGVGHANVDIIFHPANDGTFASGGIKKNAAAFNITPMDSKTVILSR